MQWCTVSRAIAVLSVLFLAAGCGKYKDQIASQKDEIEKLRLNVAGLTDDRQGLEDKVAGLEDDKRALEEKLQTLELGSRA